MVRKWMIFTLAGVFLVSGMSSAYAFSKKKCEKEGWGRQAEGAKDKSLEGKFYHKAHFIAENQEELGLSDEQIESVRTAKHKLKKEIISRDAEIESVKVDIYSKLHDQKVDAESINQLIDQKYDFKKSKAKSIVKAYADLKNGLTDEQYATMKQIWREKKK